ncbi:ABC transporter permease [Candidatus Saccharibacteria bacterium]|nr:ABC transporter permease [Candidatus Saccharibacteria bacterium]
MIVFKTFWRIMKRYWWIVFIYVAILTSLSVINLNAAPVTDFVDTKPEITIVSQDSSDLATKPFTKNFLDYLSKNTKIINLKESETTDALFYQKISMILYLPEDLESKILSGQKVTLNYRTSGNYTAELSKNLIKRYFELQRTEILESKNSSKEQSNILSENSEKIISNLNQRLDQSPTVRLASKNATNLSKIAAFFNFASYTIMAIILYVTCFINASFNKSSVKKRTMVSSLHLKKYNFSLLLANSIFAFSVFVLLTTLSFFVLGNIVLTPLFIFEILNILLYTLAALTLAELVSTFNLSRDAVSGVVNLLSLAPAFLSGAFVPTYFLPSFVLTIAHIFPTYWFIDTNNKITTMTEFNFNSFLTILPNLLILVLFSIIFIVANLVLSKKKRVNI